MKSTCGFGVAVLLLGCAFAQAADHPLDPLSPAEMSRALRVLSEAGRLGRGAWLPYLRLHEPPKASVRAWRPGEKPPARMAEATVYKGARLNRAVLNLDEAKEVSWTELKGGEAPFLAEEFPLIDRLVRANPDWQKALAKRGIRDTRRATNLSFTVGYFGPSAEEDSRLFAVATYWAAEPDEYWGRHIGGLITWVDTRNERVVRVVDTGAVPIPTTSAAYRGGRQSGLQPVDYVQSRPSFRIEGHRIEWQGWSMRWRVDPQVGVVLSNIGVGAGDTRREILYQASLSEMYVPYMDPSPDWYFRTLIDAGEFGIGRMLSRLRPNVDCPRNATVLDAVIADSSGNPQRLPNVLAVFERYSGDPLWRHEDGIAGAAEGVRAQELVVRSIATIGNYDYVLDWVFRMDGSIRVVVGATGQPLAKSVGAASADSPGGAEAEAYGRFVADHTVAVNHSHFIAFRLDFDVDGSENRFLRDKLERTRFRTTTRRTSGWTVNTKPAATESDAKMFVDLQNPSVWRVASTSRKNAWGRPTSFRIASGNTGISLMDADDWPERRVGFAKYNLWVTPYKQDERFAAGLFPNQSDGRDGLHVWTLNDRSIRDTDIVAWYVMGFHHLVRSEDWPVMPTTWHDFTLVPFDFFDRNPASR